MLNLHGKREATGSATGTVAQDRIRSAGPPARLVLAVFFVAASPLVQTSTQDEQVRLGLIIAFVTNVG